MKLGVCLPNYGSHLSREALVESARLAENLGYDSIWTTDHILVPKKHEDPYGNILDCLTSLAYLGAITQKIQLGTSILVLPVRNPIIVAKQVATIDYLTNGRLILGTAVGWMEEEFENLGASFRDRGRRFEEAINLIRTLHQNQAPRFHGRYHSFKDAVFKPRRDNAPPIWFGGNSEAALRRAAKQADGWHPVGATLETYRASVQKIKPMLPHGKQFTFSLRIHIDMDGKTEPYAASSGESRDVILGPADRAIRSIQEYRDAGLEHLVCYFGDVELALLRKKITQFAEQVMPSLK